MAIVIYIQMKKEDEALQLNHKINYSYSALIKALQQLFNSMHGYYLKLHNYYNHLILMHYF